MDEVNLKYAICLMLTPNVGPKNAKNLISYCGSPEAIFKENKRKLLKIPGIGPVQSKSLFTFKDFERAEKEIEFIKKHGIRPLYYLSNDYPHRLKEADDAPFLLFYKGDANLNHKKVLGIVGTRQATHYGKKICQKLIESLAIYDPLIVSGLAYGIDYHAHKAALDFNLNTVAVLAHGLDSMYPYAHRDIAKKMLKQGGLITEQLSGVAAAKESFPKRNRIVAGMIDALLVIETAVRGGALITAEITHSYNRDVLAVPGRTIDKFSQGCNRLIRTNKAGLIETSDDVAYHLGWDIMENSKKEIKNLIELSEIEKSVFELIQKNEKVSIDTICSVLNFKQSDLSAILLNLELKGLIYTLPGQMYSLN